MVLKIVTRRFGDVPDGLAGRLAEVTDPELLDLLADTALTATSLDALLQVLENRDHP